MTLPHLIQRARAFMEASFHSPELCRVMYCDKCEKWQEARERLEVAIETMEKEMGEKCVK